MRAGIFSTLVLLTALAPAVPAQVPVPDKQPKIETPRFKPEVFVQWLKARKAPAKVISTFEQEWKDGADSRITDRAVRAVDRAYEKAVGLVDDGEPRGVLELAKVLSSTKDSVVRAHARYFLSRALLDEDDPEGAADLLTQFIRQDRGKSYLDSEAAFYLGYSLSLVPRLDIAILNLEAFLELYPDSAERYRANATQLLQELKAQWQSPLHAIADEMKFCERRLRKDKTGNEVETKQLDIVEKLQQLIEELEKQQQQGGGSPSGNNIPNGPANQSSLPGGEGRVGKLHGSRGVKDRWGNMKDRDREKILNELNTKLPERFRVLLEKYYKRVNKSGKN